MKKPTLLRVGAVVLAAAILFGWYLYRQPRFIAGDQAPDFEIALPDGQKTRISDFKGKYVLLHFWGSWCGPCRAENPSLVAIYQKYHARGFEIISIGIEKNPKAWQRALLQDGLLWPYQAMEGYDFGGEASKLFNVKSIPATFLLNSEGVIIGHNLAPEEIEKRLSQHLARR